MHVVHQLHILGPSKLKIKLAANLTECLVERSIKRLLMCQTYGWSLE
jgi:hypothetical protein